MRIEGTRLCKVCNTIKPKIEFARQDEKTKHAFCCRECRNEAMKPYATRVGGSRARYVYLIDGGNGLFKVGIAKDMESRLRGIQLMSPVPLTLLAAKLVRDGKALEQHLHARYDYVREHGEWFRFSLAQLEEVNTIIGSAELSLHPPQRLSSDNDQ